MEQPCRTYNRAVLIKWEPNEYGMPMAVYDVELPNGTHVIMDERQLAALRALAIHLKLNREECRKKMKEFFLSFAGGNEVLRDLADKLF